MNTRILAPVVAVLAIGGAVTLAGDNDLIPTANAGSFELSVGQLKINQRISAAAVRRANKNRSDIADLQAGLGAPATSTSAAESGRPESGGAPATESGDAPSREEEGSARLEEIAPESGLRALFSTRKVMVEGAFGPILTATSKSRTLTAVCPRGYELVGGGHSVGAKVTGDPFVRVSAPVDASSNTWKVTVQRDGVPFVGGSAQETRGLRAWAVCARVNNIMPIAG